MTTEHTPQLGGGSARTPLIRFVLEGFNRSGGVRVICDVANALADDGMHIEIVVPPYAGTPSYPLDPRIRLVIPQSLPERGRRAAYVAWLARNAALAGDVLVATSYRTPWYITASAVLARRRPPILYMIQHDEALSQVEHSSAPRWLKIPMHAVAAGSYRLPTRHVAVSRWIADRVGNPDILVIPNGVDATRFYPPSPARRRHPDTFTVGGIGRPSGAKGWPELLRTMQGLREQLGQGVRFIIASPQKPPPTVPAALADIEFVHPGHDDEMRAFYQRLDLFLFTSPVEGYGLPPLEAMACGVPVVTTDCGGIHEFVDKDNVTIAPVGDVPALIAGVRELIDDPQLCQRRTEAGISTAARFTLNAQTDAWVREFRRITGSRTP